MIVYKKYATYKILEKEINIISEDLGDCYNTVAEIDSSFYYLGNEFPNVTAAVFAWQEYYNQELTDNELQQVMKDNNLLCEAI